MIQSHFYVHHSSGNSGVFYDIDAIVKVGSVFTPYYGGGSGL